MNATDNPISRAAMVRRIDALFRATSNDYLLREQFVTDPAQILSEYTCGTRLTTEQALVYNYLIYAMMSNARLLRWIGEYSNTRRNSKPSPNQFLKDFGNAVVVNGGNHVVMALVKSSGEGHRLLRQRLIEHLLDVIFDSYHSSDEATDTGATSSTTPGTYITGTEPGTYITGTEPGTYITGTEPGTYITGTEPGTYITGTEPGTYITGTEPGTYTGTEASTYTTGTEASTYTATEIMTPTSFFGRRHWTVTLEALAQHAIQLRERGVLDIET